MSGHRRSRARLLAMSVLVPLAAGCGIPTDSSPRSLDDVPFGLVATTTTVPANEPTPSGSTYGAHLYYVSGARLVGVDIELPKAATPLDQARVVLEALSSGPRETLPMRNAVLVGSQLGVMLRGSTATVELGDSVEGITPEEQLLAIGQIVLTLTRVSPIVAVEFTTGGQPASVFLPDLTTTDEPVTASNYFALLS